MKKVRIEHHIKTPESEAEYGVISMDEPYVLTDTGIQNKYTKDGITILDRDIPVKTAQVIIKALNRAWKYGHADGVKAGMKLEKSMRSEYEVQSH